MYSANRKAAPRSRWLSGIPLLFAVSFGATWEWAGFDAPTAPVLSTERLVQPALTDTAVQVEATGQPQQPAIGVAVPLPLPAAHLAALVESGITAEDSEQRSLAILELSQAPVEQSLGGLERVLRENRDSRSRLTALDALLRLPDSPRVNERRRQLLELLSRDPDAAMAEAAH